MNRITGSAADRAPRPAPALRRAYFDCRYGQLHVYQAIPAGGGFDEATAILCLPGTAGNAAEFAPLLPELGQDRSVFAIDPPGQGMSDGAAAASATAAIADFLRSMRLRRVNILARFGAQPTVQELLRESLVQYGRLAYWDSEPAMSASVENTQVPQLLLRDNESPEDSVRQLRDFFDAS